MDAARKSTLYREVNVTMEAMLRQFESEEAAQFLCECRDTGCSRRLALPCSEYEAVRRSGGYLVSLDCLADSEVLQRADHYAAVAFRSSATGGETTPSPLASSGSASSAQESSAPELSAQELSAQGPPRARSRTARSASGSSSRRGALRLVSTAGSAPVRPTPSTRSSSQLSTWSSSQPGRSWRRQSQSARLLAEPVPLRELQRLQLPPAS
jgi:hypothetical protein